MELLHNGFTLHTPKGTFPLSTDSMLLADFVRLPRDARVLDLGSGCGTLGVLLCAGDHACQVTGVECDRTAHEAALENIRHNGLTGRLNSVCMDLTQVPSLFPSGSFSCCISNPPYFSGGFTARQYPDARNDAFCSPEALFRSAAWALQYGGQFYLVHKPEKLAQLCALGCQNGLEPKQLCLVRHSPQKEVSLILLACKKGAKPGLSWQELCLHNADGTPTEDYRRIYHL